SGWLVVSGASRVVVVGGVAEMTPHRIIKERMLVLIDDATSPFCHVSRHHCIESLGEDKPRFEGIHIKIAHKNGAPVPSLALDLADLFGKSAQGSPLTVLRAIQFAPEVDDTEQERLSVGHANFANGVVKGLSAHIDESR